MTSGIALTVIAVVAGAMMFALRTEQRTPGAPKAPPAAGSLPLVEQGAWGETHPSLHLHPELTPPESDTSLIPRAVADLPPKIVENGGTLHFLITQPEWTVFDEGGRVRADADEVVVTFSDPDKGIGLELDRMAVDPRRNPRDRSWRTFDLTIPQCTRRIRLEALRGSSDTANTFFDHVFVSVRESLDFHRNIAKQTQASDALDCPEAVLLHDCGKPKVASKCDEEVPQ